MSDMPANPYVGPRAFTRHDTLFGRDVEKLNLLNILISERIVLLYSPSGAGKTSLIQAGIVPALEKERFRPLPVIRVNRQEPSPPNPPLPFETGEGGYAARRGVLPSPLSEGRLPPPPEGGSGGRRAGDEGENRYVASALHSLAEGLPDQAASDLTGLTLSEYLDRLDGGDEVSGTEGSDPVVLIFDQFEETFTVEPADLTVKDAFFAQVGEALRPRHRWALFSMREEYIAGLDPYLRHIPTRLATTFRLGLLEPPAAREAIQKPAAQVGVDFTDPAAAMLIDELVQAPVSLPDGTTKLESLPFVEPVQLQVVCTRFWERLPWADLPIAGERRQIEPGHVEELAQVDDALADYYEAKLAAVAATASEAPAVLEREIREWIDANLITERGTRAQLRVGSERDQTLPDGVIQALVDAYLIRREGRPGDRWYELAHDRLVQPIKESNAAWLREHLEPVQLQARQWDETGRRRESLLRGADLRRARGWAGANQRHLPGWEQALLTDFLGDSLREQRVFRLRAAGIAAAILVTGLLLTLFVVQRNADALEAQQRANENRSLWLASQAEAQSRDGNPALALLLANEALGTADTRDARQTLLRALTAQPGLAAVLGRLPSPPAAVVVSQDGTTAASTGCVEATFPCPASEIRVWDVAQRRFLGTLPAAGGAEVLSLAFAPDAQTLASGTSGRGIALWDMATRQPAGTPLEGSERSVSSVAFSGDGATLAAGSTSGNIVLWDLSTRQPLDSPLSAHQGRVSNLAFNRDGMMASGGADGAVLVWDGATLRLRCEPAGGSNGGDCVELAPAFDATPEAGDAGTRIDSAPPAPPQAPPPRTRAIRSLNFSSDGRWLAAGTDDGTVRVWEVASGRQLSPLPPQPVPVLGVAFSPESALLSVVTDDRTMIRWDVELGRSAEETQGVGSFSAVAFAADGVTFVSGDATGDLLVWNLAHLIPFARSFPAADAVNDVAIAPDGRALAAGLENGTVELWDVATADRIELASDSGDSITAVDFSPDGRTIAASSLVSFINRWDASTGAQLPPLAGPQETINSLAFSQDGQRIIAGGGDDVGTIRFWDTASGNEVDHIETAMGSVYSVAISPDGSTLAAGGSDGGVQLWDMRDLSAAPTVLAELESAVYSVAFSGDGEVLAAGAGDGVVSLWQVASGSALPDVSTGRNRQVYAVAFSPDDTTLAAAASDGTIDLWDVATSLEVGMLTGHTGPVWGLGFADDGALVSGGGVSDATILLWSLGVDSLRESACRIANRNLSPLEWQEFMPNQDSRPTCPDLPSEETTPTTAESAVIPDSETR